MSPICHFFASFGETTMHMWCWQLRPTVCQQMQGNYCKIMAWWDALNEGQVSVCSCKNWLHRICSTPVGIEWWKRQRFTCGDLWSEVLPKVGRITHRFAWANRGYIFQWSGTCCRVSWRKPFKKQLYTHSCCLRDTRERQLTGNQIRSFKDTLLCMPYSSWTSNECAGFCSKVLQKRSFSRCTISRLMSLLEMPMLQHTNTTRIRSTKTCTILHLQLCWEKCNVRLMRDVHLKTSFAVIITIIIILSMSPQQMTSIVASWPSYHGESHQDPELWGHFSAIHQSRQKTIWKEKIQLIPILKSWNFAEGISKKESSDSRSCW